MNLIVPLSTTQNNRGTMNYDMGQIYYGFVYQRME